MAKNKKNKSNQNYRTIAYRYYCNKCSCFYKFILDFDERLHQKCPVCEEELKYHGGTDIQISDNGNCGYCSAERVSEQNIKRIGQSAYNDMCNKDPVIKGRREGREEGKKCWWREGGKPLDLSEIKSVDKYIATGQKN